jgi:predicted O-methyltransferase YrrM
VSERSGFFIPYRYAAATRPCDYPALAPIFARAADRFADFLRNLEHHGDAFGTFGGAPPAPRFAQDWFPRLDACAAYAMIRAHRPAHIVEIGCGHSTRVMARAIADGGLDTRLICVDPAPRAKLAGLDVEHRATTVDLLDPAVLDGLCAGDVLFIDSSHIAMPGSDVDRLINDHLPRLQPGAIIHFHDIFLPHAYPEAWAWRGYNEQLLVAALLSSGGYEVLFASAYVVRHLPELVAGSIVASLPLLEGAIESSMWVRKRIPAQLA